MDRDEGVDRDAGRGPWAGLKDQALHSERKTKRHLVHIAFSFRPLSVACASLNGIVCGPAMQTWQ